MQCAIITHPPGKNYGGILQAYALSSAVKQAGHDVVLLNGPYKKLSFAKKAELFFKKLIGRDRNARFVNLQKFVHEYLPISPRWYGDSVPGAECFIVGSDQVWRPKYAALPGAYFLDFLPPEPRVKRIAYAASLGVDEWEFTPEQTREYGALVQQFDAVSVRESSAVELCSSHWQIDVRQMPDPTLLHNADFYRQSIGTKSVEKDCLFAYFLDLSAEKKLLAAETAAALGVPLVMFMDENKKGVMHPVEEFLSGIDNARMVLTDSFHGMVFSMIFQTPFAVTGNVRRGLARFKLAREAGLDRVLLAQPYSACECAEIAADKELFQGVQAFLDCERERGRAFLQNNLGGNFVPAAPSGNR